jgi:hypothetical protein
MGLPFNNVPPSQPSGEKECAGSFIVRRAAWNMVIVVQFPLSVSWAESF